MAPPSRSQLCQVCKQVNFAAILTPRDVGDKPIFRPEWSGNGESPDLEYSKGREMKQNVPPDDYLPRIRKADYDELSLSTQSDEDGHRSQRDIGLWQSLRNIQGGAELWKIMRVNEDESGNNSGKKEEVALPDVNMANSLSVEIDNANSQEQPAEGGQRRNNSENANTYEFSQGAQLVQPTSSSAEAKVATEPIYIADRYMSRPEPRSQGFVNRPGPRSQGYASRLESPSQGYASRPESPSQGYASRPESPSRGHASRRDSRSQGHVHSSDSESKESDGEDEPDASKNEANDENSDWSDDAEDNNSEESGASSRTWSNTSHFAELQRIDLDKQAQGNWNYRHGQLYYLGSIWDLRSRRHECYLCWRLWRQTRKNPEVKYEYLTKSRCILKIVELKGRRADGSNSSVSMLNLIYIYGYKLHYQPHQWTFKMPFVIQGTHRDVCDLRRNTPAHQIIPFSDRLYGEGRWQNDECNYGLFREWLRVCETKHNHPVPKFNDKIDFRLIDVQRKCLIEWIGPTSETPRFLALSYVWGMSKQKTMLTKDQLREFKEPGFFNRPLDRTIRDSIDLVLKMGEKYLWIDALCNIQDDREDMTIQVSQMHKIYGLATLTIVAAHGNNAGSGLPGVGFSSRTGNRFRLELDDIQVLFRNHTKIYAPFLDIGFTENYLLSSKYQSRAWTFQEGHLSTRLLVFTKDQVYWECEKCTWCEETHWESDMIDFIGWRALKNPTPDDEWRDRFQRSAYDYPDFEELKTSELGRNSYAALIKTYSTRALSNDHDVIRGCLGVLSSIREREQSDFVFALRTRYFGNDLLFNILRPIPRRFPNQTSVETLFPTWSWVSWNGLIEIANVPRNNSYDLVENLIPCDGLKCYLLETDQQGRRSLRVINETGGWRFHQNYVRIGEGIYDPTHDHIPSREYRGRRHLSNSVSSRSESVNSRKGRSGSSNSNGDEDSNVSSDQNDGPADNKEGQQASGLTEDAQSTQGQSNHDVHTEKSVKYAIDERSVVMSEAHEESSVPSEVNEEPSEANVDIPEYSQDLSLTDIESHPAFSQIEPNFHIIFCTFASTVVLRTEYDERSSRLSGLVMAGTRMTRGEGVFENQDEIQRQLYVVRKKKPRKADVPMETGDESRHAVDEERDSDSDSDFDSDSDSSEVDDLSSCPCCGKDTTPSPLPKGFRIGQYIGRLGALSKSWNSRAYQETVPDGVYRLLYMNNNQLPMFGHLLCKPMSESASSVGDWNGEILQRVAGAVGPPDIMVREKQVKYAAKWGTFILG